MHVIHAKDGYRCLLDVESQEVELLHNDTCIIGGSVFLPEVLDVINEHGLIEKLAIHTCMFDGWLDAFARWRSRNFTGGEDLGVLPGDVLVFPLGQHSRLEVSLHDRKTKRIDFDIITLDQEDNRWEVKRVFHCDLDYLKKAVAFFS